MAAHVNYTVYRAQLLTELYQGRRNRTERQGRGGGVLLGFYVAQSMGSTAGMQSFSLRMLSLAELGRRANVLSVVSRSFGDLNMWIPDALRERLIHNVAKEIHDIVSVVSNMIMFQSVPGFTMMTMEIVIAPIIRRHSIPPPSDHHVESANPNYRYDLMNPANDDVMEQQYDETIPVEEFPEPEIRPTPASTWPVDHPRKKMKVEDDGGEDCMICLDELQVGVELTEMPCSHKYHTKCIKQWLKQRHSCPICRFQLPAENVRKAGEEL